MLIYALDDEEIMLEVLEHCICEACPGARVRAFSLPEQLIAESKKNACDVAFLDILMPGTNGIELAKQLSEIKPTTNIIFVTGYDEYMRDAFEMFASGFISKPVTTEKIRQQLDNLRFPVTEEGPKRVLAKTFGNFTLLIDGNAVKFSRKKSLMLFAYLIHKNGTVVNKRELSDVLFDEEGEYDANKQSYMSKLCKDIQETLAQSGMSDIFHITNLGMNVDADKIDCDCWDYLRDKENAKEKYTGQYMEQYSFGEDLKYLLDDMAGIVL